VGHLVFFAVSRKEKLLNMSPVMIVGRKQIALLAILAKGTHVLGNLNMHAAKFFHVDRGWYLISKPVTKDSTLTECSAPACGALVSSGLVRHNTAMPLPIAFQAYEVSKAGQREVEGITDTE